MTVTRHVRRPLLVYAAEPSIALGRGLLIPWPPEPERLRATVIASTTAPAPSG